MSNVCRSSRKKTFVLLKDSQFLSFLTWFLSIANSQIRKKLTILRKYERFFLLPLDLHMVVRSWNCSSWNCSVIQKYDRWGLDSFFPSTAVIKLIKYKRWEKCTWEISKTYTELINLSCRYGDQGQLLISFSSRIYKHLFCISEGQKLCDFYILYYFLLLMGVWTPTHWEVSFGDVSLRNRNCCSIY